MKQSAELLDTKAAMQIRYLEMVTELGNSNYFFIQILWNIKAFTVLMIQRDEKLKKFIV